MIPLFHDFTGETVLVFGGGEVGARKARRFATEARVLVVSPQFAAADFGDAESIRADPTPADVPTWFDRVTPALAVAATDDPAVNDAVERTARERGILVNRADRAGARSAASVVVPATVRDGPVTVAVSTGGRSPALAAHLRDQIAAEVEGAGEMAELTADIRADLREADVPPERRRAALRAVVADEQVWTALDSGGFNARQVATDVISDVTGDST